MMGGMGFFHFPPSRKYLCAKITVLNNNKNDQKCLNFFFPFLEKKKKNHVYLPVIQKPLGKVE